MKSKTFPWAVVIGVVGCVWAVYANVSSSKMSESLVLERHAKLKTEQTLQFANTKIKSLETKLAESEKKFENIQAILNQGKTEANDLQSKLDNVIREKETLAKRMTELQTQAANESQVSQ